MAHIGMQAAEQETGVEHNLSSVSLLWAAIEEAREDRKGVVETAQPPIPPLIQIICGYADGSTTARELHLTTSEKDNSDYTGKVKVFTVESALGDATRYLKSQTDKELACISDKAKAQALFSKVNVGAIYQALERQAIEMLKEHSMHYALYRKCAIKYFDALSDKECGTASIRWDSQRSQFLLCINRPFLVYATIMNLMNGYPKSTMPRLSEMARRKLATQGKSGPGVEVTRVMAFTVCYVLLHEMSHIFFQHVGKRGGLYAQFDHNDVNQYGDILINLNLTKMMGGGKVDQSMVPNIGLGQDVVAETHTENARKTVWNFLDKSKVILNYAPALFGYAGSKDPSALGFAGWYRPEPASMLLIYSPGALVENGFPTVTLLNYFKTAATTLEIPKNVIHTDTPAPKKQPKTSLPVQIGQVVMIKGTGEVGVVMAVGEPIPDEHIPNHFHQGIEVVPKSALSHEEQEQIDAAVKAAGEVGGNPESDELGANVTAIPPTLKTLPSDIPRPPEPYRREENTSLPLGPPEIMEALAALDGSKRGA